MSAVAVLAVVSLLVETLLVVVCGVAGLVMPAIVIVLVAVVTAHVPVRLIVTMFDAVVAVLTEHGEPMPVPSVTVGEAGTVNAAANVTLICVRLAPPLELKVTVHVVPVAP